ncbi:MAG: hypothetical protein IJW86_02620 [Clostridia bacterium]|nr:hypothetical protein [Clostridia bacterium]
MTYSKSSADYSARYDLKRCLKSQWIFPFVAALVASFIIITGLQNYFWLKETYPDRASEYIHILMPSAKRVIVIMMGYILMGALTAVQGFSFLTSVKQCNVYLSMGITRKQLSKNRITSTLIYLAVFSAVPVAASLILNAVKLDISGELISAAIYYFLALFTAAVLGFGIGSVFTVSVGNIFESLVFSFTACFMPMILTTCIETIFTYLVNGAVFVNANLGMNGGFTDFCSTLSDKLLLFDPMKYLEAVEGIGTKYASGTAERALSASDWFPTIAFLIIGVLLVALTPKLFKKRQAENAGMFGMNKGAVCFAVTIIALAVFAFSGSMMFYWEKTVVYALCVIAPCLAALIFIAIIYRNKKDIIKNLKIVGAVALADILLHGICFTGVLGIYTHVPDIEDIEYAYVSPAASDFITTFSNSGRTEEFISEVYGKFDSEEDLKAVLAIHEKAIHNLGKGEHNSIGIVYKMKNGSEIIRYYRDVSDEAARESLKVIETTWYRDLVTDLLTNDDFDAVKAEEELSNRRYELSADRSFKNAEYELKWNIVSLYTQYSGEIAITNPTLSYGLPLSEIMTKAQQKQLRQALAEDITSMTAEDMFFNTSKPLYYLNFYLDESWFPESKFNLIYLGREIVPVYESMTNTVNYLKSFNLNLKQVTPQDVDSVQVLPLEDRFAINARIGDSVHYRLDMIVRGSYKSAEYETGMTVYGDGFEYCDNITDNTVIEKYLSAQRALACFIGDKGAFVKFNLKDGTTFVGYLAENSLQ